jgi:uncharacterized protein DUF4230
MARWRVAGAVVALGAIAGGGILWERARERAQQRESQTVVEALHRVARLSTVEMTVSDWRLRRDERALFGFLPWPCRKTVAVFYRGKVAAGFDLTGAGGQGLAVSVEAGTRRLAVRLPPARLLYVDIPPPEMVVADGSVCNQVTPDDYSRLAVEARQAIERQALAAGVLARAETHARDLLTEVVRPLGYQLEMTFGAPALSASAEHRR